jgi:hypothetical protein
VSVNSFAWLKENCGRAGTNSRSALRIARGDHLDQPVLSLKQVDSGVGNPTVQDSDPKVMPNSWRQGVLWSRWDSNPRPLRCELRIRRPAKTQVFAFSNCSHRRKSRVLHSFPFLIVVYRSRAIIFGHVLASWNPKTLSPLPNLNT